LNTPEFDSAPIVEGSHDVRALKATGSGIGDVMLTFEAGPPLPLEGSDRFGAMANLYSPEVRPPGLCGIRMHCSSPPGFATFP
jgi:hypothetical protein